TSGVDTAMVSAVGGVVSVTGSAAAIDISNADAGDVLLLSGGAGADVFTVNPLTGTTLPTVRIDTGGADGQNDTANVNGTLGADSISVATVAPGVVTVSGLGANTEVTNTETGDVVAVNGLDGDDVISASLLAAGSYRLQIDGGSGNDLIIGSQGADTLL